jgi:hypothetical protein
MLCIKLEINQGYTMIHGQPIIKNCLSRFTFKIDLKTLLN